MHSQLLRLRGEKKGHIPSRPEIVEKYSYDTKYAIQVARLAIQGLQFMKNGYIDLPVNDRDREILLGIRNGVMTYDDVLRYLETLEDSLKNIINSDSSLLPDEPNYEGIWRLSKYIHEGFWRDFPQGA